MRKHLHPIESFLLSTEEIVNCSDTIGTVMRSCFENVKICLFLIKEASLLLKKYLKLFLYQYKLMIECYKCKKNKIFKGGAL